MGDLIGKLIPLALGIAASPISILAVLAMLTSRRAMINAVTLITGWVLVMTMIGLGGLWIFEGREFKGMMGAGSHADDVANLAIGGILLLLAGVRYLQLRKGIEKSERMMKLLDIIDRLKPITALLLGVATILVNPKNLLVTLSGVGLILASGQGFGNSLLALSIFIAMATTSLILPVAICVIAPRRSAGILSAWKKWLLEHNQEVVVYLLLLLGLLLMANGLYGYLS